MAYLKHGLGDILLHVRHTPWGFSGSSGRHYVVGQSSTRVASEGEHTLAFL